MSHADASSSVPADGFLQQIARLRRQAVDVAEAERPLDDLLASRVPGPHRPFASAVSSVAGDLAVIAEIKRASPSKGPLRLTLDPAELALAYTRAGASAISVLTEPRFFAAEPADLPKARAASTLPILRKEFIVAPWQLAESRVIGADAVLLIVALLGQETGRFIARAAELGLETLVEVHDEAELEIALEAGAIVVGINNRDLHTFRVDGTTAVRLAPRARAAGCVVVAESGIRSRAEFPLLIEAGVHAVLVGESLVRSSDPEETLRALVTKQGVPPSC